MLNESPYFVFDVHYYTVAAVTPPSQMLTQQNSTVVLEQRVIFAEWLKPSEEIFAVVIFAFPCQETTPHQALHAKYRCVGVSPSFNFRVDCSALEKRRYFPLYSR